MPPPTDLIFCMRCLTPTRHSLKNEHNQTYNTENGVWHQSHQVLTCDGCKEVTYRTIVQGSEYWNEETKEMDLDVTLYPRRHANSRGFKQFMNVPQNLGCLYVEVIEAYNGELPVICAAGLRALVEGLCIDKGVKNGKVPDHNNPAAGLRTSSGLDGKINGLAQANLLTSAHANTLHKHRFLGNDAVHQLEAPGFDNLAAAIGILEHTFENIYELQGMGDCVHHRK